MEGTRKRPWSDLPPELLSMIGSRLHTRMDVLRFRSVCSSFRSSIPPLRRDASRFPFRIPRSGRSDLFLSGSTVYALETADGAPSGRARWLLKLEESEGGDIRVLSLFSRRRMASLPCELPPVLNCLQFRIIEICREYRLEYGDRTGGIKKVVVHPDCVWTDQHQCLVYFIDVERQLCCWKHGDENCSHLGWNYDDIVVYQGKVCVVDQFGSFSWINSSFKLQKLSLSIDGGSCRCHRRHRKHLVILSGDLYAVDECIRHSGAGHFRAYRLDRQCWGWEEVRSLGNSAFFLGNGRSFAVPATEIDGCEGDCIYYVENASSYSSYFWEDVKAFSLTDRSHKDVDFWFISSMKRGAIRLRG